MSPCVCAFWHTRSYSSKFRGLLGRCRRGGRIATTYAHRVMENAVLDALDSEDHRREGIHTTESRLFLPLDADGESTSRIGTSLIIDHKTPSS